MSFFLISYDSNGKSHERIAPEEEGSTFKTSITIEIILKIRSKPDVSNWTMSQQFIIFYIVSILLIIWPKTKQTNNKTEKNSSKEIFFIKTGEKILTANIEPLHLSDLTV